MVREDLFLMCEEYVRQRAAESARESPQPAEDPATEILRSFRLAEISESEMEALLAYVGDPDEDDCCQTAGIAEDDYHNLAPRVPSHEDGLPPRHPR